MSEIFKIPEKLYGVELVSECRSKISFDEDMIKFAIVSLLYTPNIQMDNGKYFHRIIAAEPAILEYNMDELENLYVAWKESGGSDIFTEFFKAIIKINVTKCAMYTSTNWNGLYHFPQLHETYMYDGEEYTEDELAESLAELIVIKR